MPPDDRRDAVTQKSPEVLVPVIGVVCAAAIVVVLAVFESPPITAANPYPVIADVFAVIMVAAAYMMWRRRLAGYVVAIVMSLIILLVFSGDLSDGLTGVADLAVFLQTLVLATVLPVVVIFSILGIRRVRRRAVHRPAPRTIPASMSVAFMAAGIIVGGAVIGAMASGVEGRLLTASSAVGDVAIVRGAGDETKPTPFSPPQLSVRVGRTVSWVNKDVVSHTVTSRSAGVFDSGSLPTGATFKFTFTKPGTYEYYCTVHAWMKATIVVAT
jgi:plastocyanin